MFLNLRVADIRACYEEWKAKGAEFVTPPIDRGAEIRCYMRAALSRTSLDRRTKLELLALVDDFVFGHALRTAETRSTFQKEPEAEVLAAIRTWASAPYEAGAFPHTLALFGRAPAEKVVAEVGGLDDEEGRFERGLATLLDGVVKNRRRPKRARRVRPS